LIPNPILKVLSTFEKNGVQLLLMGGQACVLYGAAEFSRDMDVTVLASPANLDRLRAALEELRD
jgi:PHD/YefM family antitoxin component YafN of YafNO toxin-antitoxin module